MFALHCYSKRWTRGKDTRKFVFKLEISWISVAVVAFSKSFYKNFFCCFKFSTYLSLFLLDKKGTKKLLTWYWQNFFTDVLLSPKTVVVLLLSSSIQYLWVFFCCLLFTFTARNLDRWPTKQTAAMRNWLLLLCLQL